MTLLCVSSTITVTLSAIEKAGISFSVYEENHKRDVLEKFTTSQLWKSKSSDKSKVALSVRNCFMTHESGEKTKESWSA